MTLEEILNKLTQEFNEECTGVKDYSQLAISAEAMGNLRDQNCFWIIAKEEFSHAKFIRSFLMQHDRKLTEEQSKHWVEAYEIIENKMR